MTGWTGGHPDYQLTNDELAVFYRRFLNENLDKHSRFNRYVDDVAQLLRVAVCTRACVCVYACVRARVIVAYFI